VGVQIKSGAYVPDGTTTVGTTLTIVETGDGVPGGSLTTTCVTDASTVVPSSTASYCAFPDSSEPGSYVAAPDDAVTVTQTTVNPNLVIDPTPQTFACNDPFSPAPGVVICAPETALFTDNGLPPTAVDDNASTQEGHAVDVDVLANDDTHGAPVTIDSVTQPAHGTVVIEPAAGQPAAAGPAAAQPAAAATATLRYTPDPGYIGPDPFTYTISTANGSSSATVNLRVTAPPPTAQDDTARTHSGEAVTIDVLANDDANGGGTLSISAVGTPHHGTVVPRGSELVYTPDANFTGTDTFPYTVRADGGTATAQVSVTVTAPPPAAPSDNSSSPLADTGTDVEEGLDLAAVLLLVGGASTVAGSRRRRRHAR
jgi:hypothetical protein